MYVTPDHIDSPLYVVCAIFNPRRFKARYKHAQRFFKHVIASGAVLVVVEASFGERAHAMDGCAPEFEAEPELTKAFAGGRHLYIRVQTESEIWTKESLQNIGISRVPKEARYIACCDADVLFARPNWVGETIHQLQRYAVVQMFSWVQDLTVEYEIATKPWRSFMDCYVAGLPLPTAPTYYGSGGVSQPNTWHPGFVHAWRREALDAVGGLIDWGIAGAGDNHMCHALIGSVERSVHPETSQSYRDRLFEWQARAERAIRRNVGPVKGTIAHYWHGPKSSRGYRSRWRILVDHQFDPVRDLRRNAQGLWELVDHGDARSIALRNALRDYFASRNEDALS